MTSICLIYVEFLFFVPALYDPLKHMNLYISQRAWV